MSEVATNWIIPGLFPVGLTAVIGNDPGNGASRAVANLMASQVYAGNDVNLVSHWPDQQAVLKALEPLLLAEKDWSRRVHCSPLYRRSDRRLLELASKFHLSSELAIISEWRSSSFYSSRKTLERLREIAQRTGIAIVMQSSAPFHDDERHAFDSVRILSAVLPAIRADMKADPIRPWRFWKRK